MKDKMNPDPCKKKPSLLATLLTGEEKGDIQECGYTEKRTPTNKLPRKKQVKDKQPKSKLTTTDK